MRVEGYSWNIEDNPNNCNGKLITIYHNDVPVMQISGFEALEVMGKRFVEEHAKRCNNELKSNPHSCWMKGK